MSGVAPQPNDVLFGRGFSIAAHPGNRHLRGIVDARRAQFKSAKKKEKRVIAGTIVDDILSRSPPGRFLVEDPNSVSTTKGGKDDVGVMDPIFDKVWICEDNREKCVDKVMHRLREKVRPPPPPAVDAPPVFQQSGSMSVSPSLSLSNSSSVVLGPSPLNNIVGGMVQPNVPQLNMPQHLPSQEALAAQLQSMQRIVENNLSSMAMYNPQLQQVHQMNNSQQHLMSSSQQHPMNAVSGSPSPLQQMGALAGPGGQQPILYGHEAQQIQPQHRGSQPSMGSGQLAFQSNASPGIGDGLAVPETAPSHPEVSANNEPAAPLADDLVAQELLAADDNLDFEELLGSFFEEMPPEDNPPLDLSSVPPASLPEEVPLKEWIARAKPQPGNGTKDMQAYVRAAMPVALKLAEVLGEDDEAGANFVPLASIRCENASVRAETVVLRTSPDGSPDLGGTPHRLRALGAILYELFSHAPLDEAGGGGSSGGKSVRRLSLSDDGHRRQKRNSSSLTVGNDLLDVSIARLEVMDVPHSLCALVKNLLDQGEFSGDDAYRSLADVRVDLGLMLKNPECFLDNLQVGAHPALDIKDRFYGRDDDIVRIQNCYREHVNGGCGGILVSGGAGVGKSSLVSQTTRRLAVRTKSHFAEAKFDQSNNVYPLAAIGAMFNSLCDSFARDAAQAELTVVALELESALGEQRALLGTVLPSLSKLVSSSPVGGTSSECIDPAASMQFLFRKFLETVSQHWRVVLFLDDLQWADPASLRLIASILTNASKISSVFFACCYRDDDIKEGDPFTAWLSSIETFPLKTITMQNIGAEGVNDLVSETLHVLPRLSRPLSSVLHHKTRGNPLFLRQLMESLRDRGHIHLNLNPPRWAWSLDDIANLELSDNVLALLVKERKGLPDELQTGLRVVSCLGFSSSYTCFDILSNDLGVDLRAIVDPLVQKGFMMRVDDKRIRFSHDKIQQAAYEMIPMQQRPENHMRFGLAICSHTFDTSGGKDDELFYTAVNQINRGGADCLSDSRQRVMVAALNLKAGQRSLELSDFSTALKLFEHGISFLDGNEQWASHYNLSLQLFDAAVETACALSDTQAVNRLSQQVLAHARSPDDKLKCLYAVAESLRLAFKFQESKKVAFAILEQLGEKLPQSLDDAEVQKNIQKMKLALKNMSDESICNMKETNQIKRDVLLLKTYNDLVFLFTYVDPKRASDCSLRMAQITMTNGMCALTPLALAQFAIVLVTKGDIALGYRIGTLSLRLIDRIGVQRYTSAAISMVGTLISWVAEPLQSIAETHLLGHRSGQRNGDTLYSALNYLFYLQICYQSGQNLSIARGKSRDFAFELLRRKQKFMLNGAWCIYLQSAALMEGLDYKDEKDSSGMLPTWDEMTPKSGKTHKDFFLVFSTHQYTRAFLFKRYDLVPQFDILDTISRENVSIRPIFYYGVFFEGLVAIHFARQTDANEYHRKVEAALVFMRNWSKHNAWNFGTKYKLLEAEMMHLSGYHDQASGLYEEAVRLAHQHKFVHEEAIASEQAAAFYHARGLHQKAHAFYTHSVGCYKRWGATAVAARVENDMQCKFGQGVAQGPADEFLASIAAPNEVSSRKRHD